MNSAGQAAARIVRETRAISGVVRISAERVGAQALKLSVRVENDTPFENLSASRDEVIKPRCGRRSYASRDFRRAFHIPHRSARVGACRGCDHARTFALGR